MLNNSIYIVFYIVGNDDKIISARTDLFINNFCTPVLRVKATLINVQSR